MTDNLSLSVRIGADVDPILDGLKKIDRQYDKTRKVLTEKVGKIGALEASQQSLKDMETALVSAKRKRDEFLAGAGARKEAIIGPAVAEAQTQLKALESALVEAKRKRDFFLTSAGDSAAGKKMFGKDIAEQKKAVLDLARAIEQQKARLANLPQTLDDKATKAATHGLKELESAYKKSGDAAVRQRATVSTLRGELVAAGIDTGNLATEQKRLAEQLRATDAAQARTRLKAGATVAPGADLKASAELLGLKSHAAIAAEIGRVKAAYEALRTSGTLTSAELAQAAQRTRARIAELADGMNGASTAQDRMAGGFLLMQRAYIGFQALLAGNALTRMVDDMTLLAGRVKQVTASQGQAATAMREIGRIADAAAAPIDSVGAAYVKFGRSIRAMGGSQEDALGLTEALALGLRASGATAQESASVMLQLGQAFDSGVLAGEEFKSVNEAGGRILDYLSKGLGVTRGELKGMAAEGQLTSDKILGSLLQSLPDLRREVGELPGTFGSATNAMGNALRKFGHESTLVTGGIGLMAEGVKFLSRHLDTVAGIAAAGGVAYLGVQFLVLYRNVKAVGGALELIGKRNAWLLGLSLLAGVGIEAWQRYKGKIEETDAAGAELARNEAERAKELRDRLENLATRRTTLEKQVAENAKAAQKEVLDGQKKAIAEQISDAETLRDALIAAYEEAGRAAETARKQAADLRGEAAKKRTETGNRLEDRRLDKLAQSDPYSAELERQAAAQAAMQQAELAHARAVEARYANNQQAAERYTKESELQLERANQLAGALQDDAVAQGLVAQAGELAARNLEEQARQAEAKAAAEEELQRGLAQQQQANAQALEAYRGQLAEVEKALKDLAEAGKNVKIEADQASLKKVLADIAQVKAELAAIPDRTVTVTVRQVGGASGRWATGGLIAGPGHDSSDNLLAWLSPGEFVMRAAAVRKWGAERLAAMNAGRLPQFAAGGAVLRAVASVPRFAAGGPVVAPPVLQPLNLTVPGLGTYPVQALPEVAAEISRMFAREAMMRGARR